MFPENLPPHNIRLFWHRRLFWVVCGIPTLLSAFYLFIWATPRFESEAVIRVYEAGSDTSSAGSTVESMSGSLIVSPGPYVLKKYLSSWDAFQALAPETLKAEWSKGDLFTRFGGIQTAFLSNPMRLWKYFRSHLTVSIDETSGLLTVRTEGYSKDFPEAFLQSALLKAQEHLAQSGGKADIAVRDMLVKRLNADKQNLVSDLSQLQNLRGGGGIALREGHSVSFRIPNLQNCFLIANWMQIHF